MGALAIPDVDERVDIVEDVRPQRPWQTVVWDDPVNLMSYVTHVFREPLLAICDDEQQLRDEIHVTLVHEIAHFYGIDDDELHRLGWA